MNVRQPPVELGRLKSRSARIVQCIAALIVLACGRTVEARSSNAVPVFHCAFGDDWDVNYDGWPDRWERKVGPDYPHYVNVGIQDDEEVAGKKCLRIDLDGAAAAVASPPIRVMSRFSYVFEAQLKNENLNRSAVVISLNFCDSAGKVLQTEKIERVSTVSGWQTVRIGPVEPRDPGIDHAVLELAVIRGGKGDLKGRVSLADLWLERLPRIDVSTNNSCNVYTDGNDVEVKCALSGIRERDPEVTFELLDASNQLLQSKQFRLNGQLIVNKAAHGTGPAEGNDGPDGYEGTIRWQPKIPDFGFYRVVVRMKGTENAAATAENSENSFGDRAVDLVVVPPLEMPRHGEFGWTLPDADQPLSFQDLSRLLPQVGISWAKVPVWFDASDQRRGDELIRFVELLGASNIDVVGIIDSPPNKATKTGRQLRDMSIADILSQDSSTWSAALEPVMSRLALRVRWWQLGRDYDTSLIGQTKLNKRMDDLRTTLFRFGQDVRMGLCADWDVADSHTGKVSWDFVQLARQTAATDKKFEELLAKPSQNTAQRWIVVDPPTPASFQPPPSDLDIDVCARSVPIASGSEFLIPAWVEAGFEEPRRSEAAHTARASAFVHRLVAAKLHGADAIIIAKPFDNVNGLMRADGMPAELLLPWRTTAAMLGGAKYLGHLQLPNDSPNEIFLRQDGQLVMVIWNERPTREVLYLGDSVQEFDILGRSKAAAKQGREQVIDVGPTPSFVLGLNEAVTRWRMNVKFETTQVPSVFSRPHHDSVSFTNFFPQGVGGTVKIVVLQDQAAGNATAHQDPASLSPDRWTIEPPQASFQLAAGAATKFPFDIKLKNALYGKQPIRVDFTIEAEERLQFSTYGQMEVGTADLTLDVKSHVDKDGTLIVEQVMTNRTGHLADFKCHLRSKGYRPQRMQVYRLGHEPDRKVYRFPDGQDLVGKEMLLEIEEVNGQRVLKYRFVASERVKNADDAGDKNSDSSEDAHKVESVDSPRPLAKLGS